MKKRSIAGYIVLSIITCGIYHIVVSYLMLADMEKEGITSKIPSWAVLLLHFVNIGVSVGGATLGYAASENLKQIRAARGLPAEDNMVLWLVLGLFFPMITGALIQHSVNQMLDGR